MLTESFVTATLAANKPSPQTSTTLKDCLAISDSHIFAAQADKAIINVYNRTKGTREATIPFPDRVRSLAYANDAAILILGTEGGKLILWEVATGRVSTSAASHLQHISSISLSGNDDYILSGSSDTNVHVWSLSNLIAFRKPTDSFGNEISTNTPFRTFANHRSGIVALGSGNSKYATNFAISASEDQTCYLWHIESCQILRTFLLPSTPICMIIDPADRAVYFGDAKGHINMIDIMRTTFDNKIAAIGGSGEIPIQVSEKNTWIFPSGQVGPANCITLSFDGTALISGHATGVIIKWDIAKRKVLNEIANLAQPVTNICMLRPEGLPHNGSNSYAISNVVKPKLEFNAQSDNGTCGIPAGYTFQAIISSDLLSDEEVNEQVYRALTGPGFPQSILDDALRALAVGSNSNGTRVAEDNNVRTLSQVENLEDQVVNLKRQLAAIHDVEEKRTARRMVRMEKREELGLKKRQAYFDAKKKGEDGDVAMKKWEDQEAMIDVESDDEYLGDGMDAG